MPTAAAYHNSETLCTRTKSGHETQSVVKIFFEKVSHPREITYVSTQMAKGVSKYGRLSLAVKSISAIVTAQGNRDI